MNDKERNNLRKKLEFYREEKIKVHIDTITKRFYNGEIINIKEDSFTFNDRRMGILLILFDEVAVIEPSKKIDGEIAEDFRFGNYQP
jgi:hypothetical protein